METLGIIGMGCAAVVAAAGGIVWVAGQLAGFATHRAWPAVPGGVAPRLAWRLAQTPGDPAAAWPAEVRGQLGPAPLMWVCLAVVVTAPVPLVWWAVRAARGRGVGPATDGFARRAPLAKGGSVKAARSRAPQTRPSLKEPKKAPPAEVGYPLGFTRRPGGVALWPSWEASLRVVGPPGSGKTLRVFARIARQHPGPAIITSTKPDLCELSATERARRGPVVVLDPDRLAPSLPPVRWSPVAGCEDSRVAERRAQALVAASGDDAGHHAEFFRGSAADVLKGYLHAAALTGRTMRDVAGWAARPNDTTAMRILAGHPTTAVDWAGTIGTHTSGAEQTTSGVMRTLARALACFGHSDVMEMCCPEPGEEFDVERFVHTSGTVYLLGKQPAAGTGGVAPLLTAFAEELLDVAERAAAGRPARRLDPPLLALLDEAPSICPIPSLPQRLADGRGRGIVVAYGMQSPAQARDRWGTNGAQAMNDATTVSVVLRGLRSVEDLQDLERLCGQRRIQRHSNSDSINGRSVTVASELEPVVTVAEIRSLPVGVGLVLWDDFPPTLVYLPGLWEERGWKAIAAEEAALRAANDAARHPARNPARAAAG